MKTLVLLLSLLTPVEQADSTLQQAMQQHRVPALERTMRTASDIGKPVVVFGVLLAIAVCDVAQGVPLARVALVSAAVVNLAVEVIKRTTDRTRPDGERKRSNASFPSSHAANAFALAVLFCRRWPKGSILFLGGATLVAVSRVYLNRHFTSDVVAGALLGAGLALWVSRQMRWPAASAPTAVARK